MMHSQKNIKFEFMLRAFCDCYNLVKWQTLKSREFAASFVWWHHK